MSDAEDWLAKYRREEAERHARAEKMGQYLMGALRFLGVDLVEVEFDGYGDEGEVQEPEFTPDPPGGLPEGLGELVGQVCGGMLPGGWEINSGSFGTVEIDVRAGTVEVDMEWREEDEDDYDEEDDP
jgi:hypothetical protein